MILSDTFELLKFQADDVEKLHTKRSRLIGNDPGTGKTFEGIALDILNRRGEGNSKVDLSELFPTGKAGVKTLIICPKSVTGAWDEHCMKLTHENVYVVDTKKRHLIMEKLADPRSAGLFVVTWDFVRLEIDRLEKIYFLHVIADECHKAKGHKSQQTRALKRLKAVYKTAMSGTPADNKPEDIWSILNWLWPNFYNDRWKFIDAYIEWHLEEIKVDGKVVEGKGYRKLGKPKNLAHLHKEMAPWFVRHTKKEVLPDLPDKYYTRYWVDLAPKQRKAYDQMKRTMIAWVDQHKEEIERQDPIITSAAIAQLTRLQQFACGYMIPKLNENDEQLFVRKHKRHKRGECPWADVPLGELDITITDGTCRDVAQYVMTDPSTKLDLVMDLIKERWEDQDDQDPFIIWSSFKSVIGLLEGRLRAAGIPYGILTGDVDQRSRDQHVADFQAGHTKIFIGTIAAGGVGITLTASSTVAFIDRTWSPAINIQAEDRAHRIGQTQAVQVIDLMAKNTVDLGKSQQIANKWEWLQMLMGDEITEETVRNIDADNGVHVENIILEQLEEE